MWVGPVLTVLLIAILLSRHSSPSSRAAWLWFGVPFLFYYFLVWDPRTHVLNVFPGAALLAASTLDHLVRTAPWPPRLVNSLPLRLAVTVPQVAIFLFLAYYPYLMFVQHSPEIRRTWPAHQPALFWRPTGETPLFGYFGFPYRAGWKVVGTLLEEGVLSGVYASNEEQEITGWYTREAQRTYCATPEWVLVARNVQDEVSISQYELKTSYYVWGEIRVAGEPKLWLFRRGSSDTPPLTFHVENYVSRFDARTRSGSVVPSLPTETTLTDYTLGDLIRLWGYRLDTTDAHPGGHIHVVLYWEALRPIETNYQVFNHLYDGTMWGQQDSTPGCGALPTVLWEPGQIVRDEYTIAIDPSTSARDVPLLVGMYSLATGERLPVRGPDGAPAGDTISLMVVAVR